MQKNIYIVGPGGAGKSTSGVLLSEILGYKFIDLDFEFCDSIGNIGTYINNKGYEKYCEENKRLFQKLLNENKEKTVFALSSGFLTYENVSSLKSGIIVSLLPSSDLEESVQVILERQMKRDWELDRSIEEQKIRDRYFVYNDVGDVQIYSTESPVKIAQEIKEKVITKI